MSDGSVTIEVTLTKEQLKEGLNSIDKDLKKINKPAKDVSKSLGNGFEEATKSTKNTSNALNGLKNTAIKVVGAIGIGNLVKDGIAYNGTIEQLTTSFEVMTGSVEKANDVVAKLKDIGAKTPFEFTGLAETTQMLMQYGFTADEAINRMKMLGDISQGSADKMNRIAMAYGQMSSAGKVSLEDIKQMIEAGFNPLQEISNTTGESMASLYDRISKGKISVDEITASMQRSTSAGGKYFQSMEKQSQTLNGQMSTLKDNFDNVLGKALQGISDVLSNSVLPAVNDFLEKLSTAIDTTDWEKLKDTFQNLVPVISGVTIALVVFKGAMAIKGVIDGVKTAFIGLNAVMKANPILLIVSLIASLVSGLIILWNTNEGFRNAVIGIWNSIKSVIGNVVNAIVIFFTQTIPNAWNSFTTGLSNLGATIWNTLINVWNSIISFFTEGIPNFINTIIQWIQNLPYQLGYIAGQMLGQILQFGVDAWNWVTVELPKIILGIVQWFSELPGKIWEWLKQAVNNIIKWGVETWQQSNQAMINFFNNIINWFKQLPGNIWNWLVDTVRNIINWGIDMKNKADEAVRSMVDGIINTIKELPGKMLQWGKDMIQGLINGIKSMIGNVGKAISGVADGIKSVIHFSRPDKGPLRNYEKWMPDMVDGLTKTLNASAPKLYNASKSLAEKIRSGFDISGMYNRMERAVAVETGRISTNLSTTANISKTMHATIQVNGDTYLDSTKVGRMIAPEVTKTIKGGGIH